MLRTDRAFLTAVLVSAIAAGFATTAPTMHSALDLVYRALFAGGVVLAATAARRFGLVVVGGIVLAGAGTPAALALSVFALGAAVVLAVGVALRPHQRDLVRLSVGIALGQAMLRLGTLSSDRATAVISFVAVIVLVGSCLRRNPWQRRVALGAFAMIAIGVPTALGLWSHERRVVSEAATSMESGIQAARSGDSAKATEELQHARDAFANLQSDLGALWVRPARLIPGAAQQLVAARALVGAGVELSDTAIELAAKVDPRQVNIEQGHIDLAALADLAEPLDQAAGSLEAARAKTRGIDPTWLIPSVRSVFDDFEQRIGDALVGARRARDAVRVAPDLLGSNGPRRYFLALQTNAEMRGTGGLIGNYGVLTADDGEIKLERFGRIEELNPPETGPRRLNIAGPADYIARYRDSFSLEKHWQNLTASPDFPSVGEVIVGLGPQSGLGQLDGAIAIDPFGLAALLRATGPVTVPDWPEPLTGDNAAEILLYRQYVAFGDIANAERVEFLASTSAAVFERLTSGALTSIATLVDSVAPAVRSKHVQLFSTNPSSQQVFVDAGIAGAVAPVTNDFLGVVTQDGTPSKLDWFQRRSIRYSAVVNPRMRTIDSVATITVRNTAPTTGLPSLAYGLSHWSLEPNTSRVYVSVYSPLALGEATVDGRPVTMESADELGRFVYSTFVIIPPGGTSTIQLKLSGLMPPSGDYEIFFSRQPAVAPDDLSFQFTRAGTRKPAVSERIDLDADAVRTVRLEP